MHTFIARARAANNTTLAALQFSRLPTSDVRW